MCFRALLASLADSALCRCMSVSFSVASLGACFSLSSTVKSFCKLIRSTCRSFIEFFCSFSILLLRVLSFLQFHLKSDNTFFARAARFFPFPFVGATFSDALVFVVSATMTGNVHTSSNKSSKHWIPSINASQRFLGLLRSARKAKYAAVDGALKFLSSSRTTFARLTDFLLFSRWIQPPRIRT